MIVGERDFNKRRLAGMLQSSLYEEVGAKPIEMVLGEEKTLGYGCVKVDRGVYKGI